MIPCYSWCDYIRHRYTTLMDRTSLWSNVRTRQTPYVNCNRDEPRW